MGKLFKVANHHESPINTGCYDWFKLKQYLCGSSDIWSDVNISILSNAVIRNFVPPRFRKVKQPENGKVKQPTRSDYSDSVINY